MFDLNAEAFKRARDEISKAAGEIQERMINDAVFGESPPYSPFASTGTLHPSRPLVPFGAIVPLWNVTTSPYVVEKKKQSREKVQTFWQMIWRSLTDISHPWPYSQIEIYEVEIPAIMIDRPNHQIICHPSLEREIKKAIRGGYEPAKC